MPGHFQINVVNVVNVVASPRYEANAFHPIDQMSSCIKVVPTWE